MDSSDRVGDVKAEVSFEENENKGNLWKVIEEDGTDLKIKCIQGENENTIKFVNAVEFYSSAKYEEIDR